MTDDTTPSLPDQAIATDRAVLDEPSPAVCAFVAAAITEYRRDNGFSQLLADLDAAAEPTDADRDWARGALGVS